MHRASHAMLEFLHYVYTMVLHALLGVLYRVQCDLLRPFSLNNVRLYSMTYLVVELIAATVLLFVTQIRGGAFRVKAPSQRTSFKARDRLVFAACWLISSDAIVSLCGTAYLRLGQNLGEVLACGTLALPPMAAMASNPFSQTDNKYNVGRGLSPRIDSAKR